MCENIFMIDMRIVYRTSLLTQTILLSSCILTNLSLNPFPTLLSFELSFPPPHYFTTLPSSHGDMKISKMKCLHKRPVLFNLEMG